MDPVTTLTNSDVRWCIETYLELWSSEDDSYDGPETVCLSFGYAAVCSDGDVMAWGRAIINVEGLDTDGIPEDDEPYAAQTANTPDGEE